MGFAPVACPRLPLLPCWLVKLIELGKRVKNFIGCQKFEDPFLRSIFEETADCPEPFWRVFLCKHRLQLGAVDSIVPNPLFPVFLFCPSVPIFQTRYGLLSPRGDSWMWIVQQRGSLLDPRCDHW